ncbi:MAG: serine hydrolase, partial [Candidatus Hydrogenedentes bacterium]|nr:serine hydrolase [Candidatus Hydrogenedentota bacterium]
MSTVRFAMKFKRSAAVAMLLFVGCVASSGAMAQGAEETALDRYVNTPDPHYAYELLHWNDEAGYNTYVLEMTSQKWLDEETVDRPIWKHWLVIVRPDEVDTNIGFLYIGAGNNTDDAPAQASPRIVALAQATNSVVGQLYMVPNQPLTFVWDETRKRYEDEIIAYTWDKYLRGGDEKWPLRLPMTKSAVRAMDTITSFAADDRLGNLTVDRFVVAGGSKRGWTISHNPGRLFPSASLVKIPIMVALYQAEVKGHISLDDSFPILRRLKARGSGNLRYNKPGTRFTVRELIYRMITESDNTATNVLANMFGLEYYNAQFLNLGLSHTNFSRMIMDLRKRNRGIDNYTTAEDMAQVHAQMVSIPALAYLDVIERLEPLDAASAAARDRLLAWNGEMGARLVEPTIYSAMRDALLKEVLETNLTEKLADDA